ncbi:MAG: CinA family protein [Arsenophonus sp.]|nr:MAG: CinA family protein [Arsenophonus sp.]
MIYKEEKIHYLSKILGSILAKNKKTITFAESCTGGWVSKVITDIPGSSKYFNQSFITYSNESKKDILKINLGNLERYGVVSEYTAIKMAEKVLKISKSDYSASITGIAGPHLCKNNKNDKVGVIWFGFANREKNRKTLSRCCHFKGNRISIRKQAVKYTLLTLINEVIID